MNIESLVDKARESKLFTAPILGPHLSRFMEAQGERLRRLAAKATEEGVEHVYWVGSGNSWTNLYSGKYLMDRLCGLPSDCFTSCELVSRAPLRLNKKAWVFLASFSGATEDTVEALRFANARGARTIALVDEASSLMGREAKEAIPYNSKGLYIMPLAAACMFAAELGRLLGNAEAQAVLKGMDTLPALLSKQYVAEEAPARKLAEQFADEKLFYVLGTGPLYGLAYKFGLTVFMENMRVNGSFVDTPEWRHGPVEALSREKPAMVFLKGTDETRPMVERVMSTAREAGARLIAYDVADYPGVHPLLAPFALMIPLQWFAVYSSLLRGIEDLDERVYMGRGVLGKGAGIKWP